MKSAFGLEFVEPKDKDAVIVQVKALAQVQEFMAIYPQATLERLGHPDDFQVFSGNEKDVEETLYAWFTTGLHSRYLLTMAIPFKLAGDRIHLASIGKPSFHIQELESVTVTYSPNLPSGQAHIQYSTFSANFGPEKLKTLKEHAGDISSIGIDLVRHDPVANFERVWKPDK